MSLTLAAMPGLSATADSPWHMASETARMSCKYPAKEFLCGLGHLTRSSWALHVEQPGPWGPWELKNIIVKRHLPAIRNQRSQELLMPVPSPSFVIKVLIFPTTRDASLVYFCLETLPQDTEAGVTLLTVWAHLPWVTLLLWAHVGKGRFFRAVRTLHLSNLLELYHQSAHADIQPARKAKFGGG